MDLIILAAIACFILFRLKNQIGQVDDNEKNLIKKKLDAKIKEIHKEIIKQTQDQINNSQDFIKKDQEVKNQILANLDELSKNNLNKILKKSNISLDFFMNGAKSAFEMVLDAFSKNDLTTLQPLLSAKIFEGFEKSIKHRQTLGQKLVTNLISIKNVEITKVDLVGSEAAIKISFLSKQINYIQDQNNDSLISGSKEEIKELHDVWTFKKDLNSTNPNWLVVSTN